VVDDFSVVVEFVTASWHGTPSDDGIANAGCFFRDGSLRAGARCFASEQGKFR
jgi:hypothetical protein